MNASAFYFFVYSGCALYRTSSLGLQKARLPLRTAVAETEIIRSLYVTSRLLHFRRLDVKSSTYLAGAVQLKNLAANMSIIYLGLLCPSVEMSLTRANVVVVELFVKSQLQLTVVAVNNEARNQLRRF